MDRNPVRHVPGGPGTGRPAGAPLSRGILVWLLLGALPAQVWGLPTLTGVAGTASTGVASGNGVLLYSSTNHVSWFQASGTDSSLFYTAVIHAGSKYLAVAEDGSAWRSDDATGNAFTHLAQAGSGGLNGLTVVGDQVLAVGEGGQILLSSDVTGGSWVSQASPVSSPLRGAAWNGVNTIAVGDAGVILRGGAQGTGWTRIDIGETRAFLAVVADPPSGPPGQYLAVGEDGMMWKGEPDGLTWTPLESPTNLTLRSAARVGLSTVVVGDQGIIYYSAGGYVGWIPASNPGHETLRGVTFTESSVVAVGDRGSVLYSLTGLTWSESAVPAEEVSWGALKHRFAPPR